MKRIVSLFIAFSMMVVPAYAEASQIDTIISDTANFVMETVKEPQISSIGGEWAVIGLAKCGESIPKDYFESYYNNVENTVKDLKGVLSSRKYTEYSRVTLALTLIGKNPENVAGYNLVTPLSDFNAVTRQGINGSIWALIALDSGNYADSGIKAKYANKILESELKTGGWSMSQNSEEADADVTAMAITALSGHMNEIGVSEAVERGVSCLLKMQDADGGFSTYGEATSESTAQVITALSTLGMDLEKFSKNGVTPLDALISYYNKGRGFSHSVGGESNLMATEQALYALSAVKCFKEGKSKIFSAEKIFSDIAGNVSETAILELVKKGIINGMGDGTFAPEKSVTRAEFTAIAVKTLGLSGDARSSFSDVAETEWFYPYISLAFENKIIYGVSETEFNPQGRITCEEATAMVERIAKKSGLKEESEEIPDIISDISEWAIKPYAFCLGTGILEDAKPPKKELNRAEIAQMIYNMLKKAENL
ncbi:MAG: S-layer homology domain-containing protein [Clostridia bacterium]|nr:S-layer homology domain-containing protein [Clostridia bacterium]